MNRGVQTRKGKIAVLALAVALLVVGTLVAYTYTGTRSKSTSSLSSAGSSTTATGSQWTLFNSTISQDGLQLAVALNTTSLIAGKSLSAEAYLTNTLSTNVSLSPDFSAQSRLAALSASGCQGAGFFGMLNLGLYQGHYTAANFSQAVPLLLVPWFLSGCPNPYMDQSFYQRVEFAPNGDVATVSCNNCSSIQSFSNPMPGFNESKVLFKPSTIRMQTGLRTGNCTAYPYNQGPSVGIVNRTTTTFSGGAVWSMACGPDEGLTGYWTMPPSDLLTAIMITHDSTELQYAQAVYDCCYHEFTPGAYTIVAEDLWNQTVFAHFEVRASPSSSVGGANTVVATDTVTETTTTQAARPTTSYAYPPDCAGTHLTITVTSTTTTTVGAASTTTVTVTVTLPSYTQTVTTAACAYSTPTVTSTSTVTSTVTP